MKAFPFPDKDGAGEELERDLLYRKIPVGELERILDMAWNRGVSAAKMISEKYPRKSMEEISKWEGLRIKRIPSDQVSGRIRYFSEYYSGRREIILYLASIEKWAEHNRLSDKEAVEMILSHEIYHHLECTKLGLTSDLYQIPIIRIGKLKIGKSGIRALSEIGAHGFSRTIYEIKENKTVM